MFRMTLLWIILMSAVVFAQNANTSTAEAVKLDEFGLLGDCEFGARLDNFLVELMEKPNARGYIIYYESKNALPSQIESVNDGKMFMNYINFRKFDPSRISIITSYREEMATELWLVPENAEPPKPTDSIEKPKISLDKTLLYDRGSIDSYNDFDNYIDLVIPLKKAEFEQSTTVDEETSEETVVDQNFEEPKLSAEELENLKFSWTSERFGKFLEKNKKMQGVILFYADDQEFDINKVMSHIEEGKQRIAKSANISPERIQILFGGYKSYLQIEFWAVPEKGKFPAPEPEERVIEIETEIEDQ